MQVNRPSNIPGVAQGAATDRANRDGQRKQQGKDEGKKPQHEEDAVELHAPTDEAAPVAPLKPKPSTPAPRRDVPPAKQPPLDLSA